MAQAWASPAVSTAGSQAAPKIPTSCRRSSDRSQTVVQLPACLAPQFEPHVVPSRRVPRLSSLALTRIRQRLLGCRIFTPAQPSHSAASSEGFLLRRLQENVRIPAETPIADGIAVDPDYKGKGLQLQFTVEDEG